MRINSFASILLFALAVAGSASAQEKSFSRSLEVGGVYSYSYKDSFSGAGNSYGAALNYGFIFSENYVLGISLVRFQDYFQAPVRLTNFAYGFFFRHYLPKEIVNTQPLTFWLSYGILLNQAFESGVDGREIGHDTHLGIGTDWTIVPEHRLFFELGWDMVSYPSFGTKTVLELSTLNAQAGYRWLF